MATGLGSGADEPWGLEWGRDRPEEGSHVPVPLRQC